MPDFLEKLYVATVNYAGMKQVKEKVVVGGLKLDVGIVY
jgi:hypothetical protein